MKYYSSKARQAGMTLIELTVVLLVLIGLAGLMIPYVAGFISKTHDSTGDSNLARLNSTIQRFQTTSMKFPNDLQALADSTGVHYSKLMNNHVADNTTSTFLPYITTKYTAASMIPLMSLQKAGITSIMDLGTGSPSATFNAAGNPIDLTSTTVNLGVLKVNVGAEAGTASATNNYGSIEKALADAFGRQPSKFNATCNDYIILGIGQENEMVGKAMSEAPVHFAQNGNMGPDNNYNRFVAVFEVQKVKGAQTVNAPSAPVDANGNALTSVDCGQTIHPAKFIGSAMLMMPDHLWGLAHAQGHTYTNIANGN